MVVGSPRYCRKEEAHLWQGLQCPGRCNRVDYDLGRTILRYLSMTAAMSQSLRKLFNELCYKRVGSKRRGVRLRANRYHGRLSAGTTASHLQCTRPRRGAKAWLPVRAGATLADAHLEGRVSKLQNCRVRWAR
jgi:hypothetical protein